jgi:hypothetical protein
VRATHTVTPRVSSALLPVLGCAVALAACGGSGHKSSASASSAYAFATCMRAHGVPNFPDPTASAGGAGFSVAQVPGSSVVTVDGVTFSGPAFQGASKACSHVGGGISPPPLSEAQKQGMIAKARCIREHGVPGFPDPTIGPGGKGVGMQLGRGFNPDSPAMRHAAKACAAVGVSIPHTPT